jgi:putative transposase
MASTYLCLNVHIIFATKNRAPMIDDAWRDGLHAYLAGTLRGLGATPHAVGGVADHVHILTAIRATHCISDLVRETKKASSSWARERYDPFTWQEGYAALSVGREGLKPLAIYIEKQEEHHRKLSSADELRALLAEHGIEYDARFFE